MSKGAPSSQDALTKLKRALQAMEKMQARLDELEGAASEPVAVTGMGCRFPGGGSDPATLWDLLVGGGDAVTRVPENRGFGASSSLEPGAGYGAFLEDVESFDADFFGISPREAAHLDPQQRLLLEVAWEALENAGESPADLMGAPCGVFVGISTFDHAASRFGRWKIDDIDAYFVTGGFPSMASGRLSYVLGFTGPSLSVDTACSSSLTAVHLACRSLRQRECRLALAGGVNVMLEPQIGVAFSRIGMLSPTGRCKTFDASADGYVRGEGCGVLVLKRLSDALADGDPVWAVIRGSAVNQDGRSAGLTVPNGPSQERVIRDALRQAGASPADVGYLEAHGTGTPLGDPVEMGALGNVFGERNDSSPLWVGSIKTNLGHLEAAAGVAGLVKAILVLKHRKIPPHLHFRSPNPRMNWNRLPVRIPGELAEWTGEGPFVVGVSSFGAGGANAHVVLEEAPEGQGGRRKTEGGRRKTDVGANPGVRPQYAAGVERQPAHRDIPAPTAYGLQPIAYHLLPLSAKTPEALQALALRYRKFLDAPCPGGAIGDICYTAAVGRSHFSHRLAIAGRSREEWVEQLETFLNDTASPESRKDEAKGLATRDPRPATEAMETAFLFTGQGSQYKGMARELYHARKVFRDHLDRCDAFLREEWQVPLLDLLYDPRSPGSRLDETLYTQPVLFALETGLAELWKAWGVEAAAVMGHSVGEYAAACFAGAFNLEDGLMLAAARGRFMHQAPGDGAMAAILAAPSRVEKVLGEYPGVTIAAFNGPRNVVVSGHRSRVEDVIRRMEAEGVEARRLAVSHAFHSPLMKPVQEDFASVARRVSYSPPSIPVVSNVTGKMAGPEMARAEYWVDHVLRPVRFAQGMEALEQAGCRVFLEIGPKPVLAGMGRLCLPRSDLLWLPSLRPGTEDEETLLRSLGDLYRQGAAVRWRAVHEGADRRKARLPSYPFQRERFPLEKNGAPCEDTGRLDETSIEDAVHPLLGRRLDSPALGPGVAVFEGRWREDSPQFMKDHRVFGRAVAPAAAYVEMALAAIGRTRGFPPSPAHETIQSEATDLLIHRALTLPEGKPVKVQLLREREDDEGHAFRIFSRRAGGEEAEWILHASGRLRPSPDFPGSGRAGRGEGAGEGEGAGSPLRVLPGVSRDSVGSGGAAPFPQTARRDPEEPKSRCPQEIDCETYYGELEEKGLRYGPAFRTMERLWRGEGESLTRVRLSGQAEQEAEGLTVHPALLDGCFQGASAAFPPTGPSETYLPMKIERIALYRPAGTAVWSHARLRSGEATPEMLTVDVALMDDEGRALLEVQGLSARRATPQAVLDSFAEAPEEGRKIKGEEWLHEIVWRSAPRTPSKAAEASPGFYLLLADDGGWADELARSLEDGGSRCVKVKRGEAFREDVPGREYALRPDNPRDFQRLRERVAEEWAVVSRQRSVGSGQMLTDPLVPHPAPRTPHPALPCKAIHCWTLDDFSSRSVEEAQEAGCIALLHLLQAGEPLDSLHVITRGAVPAGPEPAPLRVEHTPLWGMVQTLNWERPHLKCFLLDLDPAESDGEASLVLQEIARPDEEDRLAFRKGVRYAARLAPLAIPTRDPRPETRDRHSEPSEKSLRVTLPRPGVLDHLVLEPAERRSPGPGEVEIQVAAAGLNFRDVLTALGTIPPAARTDEGHILLGLECAGRVASTGPGVSRLRPGDEVMAQGTGTLARYAIVHEKDVALKPAGLSFREAATLPGPFLTALYALERLAELKRGESVLVHAAAGGVGLAAVRIARRAGAEIHATAHPDKWDFLRSLGVESVTSSRSPEFADRILERTERRGVDVVLNSLAGEMLVRSLEVVASGGRFVELGKTKVLSEEEARRLRPDIAYLPFDLSELARKDAGLVPSLLADLTRGIEQGSLKPLPFLEFPMTGEGVVEAFRTMARGKHRGRVLITGSRVEGRGSRVDPSCAETRGRGERRGTPQEEASWTHRHSGTLLAGIDPRATYLVTGGLGSLGVLAAEWMADRGARHLVLVGRANFPAEGSAREAVESLEAKGAGVTVLQGDVSRKEDVARILEIIARDLPPLRGVVHAAGVLDDGALQNQSVERFFKVFAPKASGAWNLHQATLDHDLDFFILYSSAASVTGSGGQSNYAAANAFLDGLAHYRHALGLSALSVDWGPWAESAMVRSMGDGGSRAAAQGWKAMSPREALPLLEELLRQGVPQGAVLPLDWDRFLDAFPSRTLSPFYGEIVAANRRGGPAAPVRIREHQGEHPGSPLRCCGVRVGNDPVRTGGLAGSSGNRRGGLPQPSGNRTDEHPGSPGVANRRGGPACPPANQWLQRMEAIPLDERKEALQEHVRFRIAQVLRLRSPASLEPRRRLFDAGIDSLMAVELKNRLEADAGRPLPSTLVFDHPTLEALTDHLYGEVLGWSAETFGDEESEPAPPPDDRRGGPACPPGVDDLSETDVARLLELELDAIEKSRDRG